MSDADFKRAKELYNSAWSISLFINIGVWPLEKAYLTFALCITFLIVHMMLEIYDLLLVLGDLQLMVTNLSEFTLEMMIIGKMIVMRFSGTFAKLVVRINDGIGPKMFGSDEEKKSYLKYNDIVKSFYPFWYFLALSSSIIYHLRPLEFRLREAFGEERMPYVLPYRARFFVEVNDTYTFWIAYVYQTPVVFLNTFYGMSVGYVCSVVLHVCGHLSALAIRIKNVDVQFRNDPENSTIILRDIVRRHRYISSLTIDINTVFKFLLLEELVISTVILGLTAYSVLLNSDEGDMATLISFFMYVAVVLLLIYSYCIAGEYLINESNNVCDSYYQCQWYDLSNSVKRQLIICMIGASKPLELTGGGIYVYCVENFTGILKSAAGYLSMLRAMV